MLDVTDPFNPVEVDRLSTGSDYGTHWLSPNKNGDKIVLTGFFKELERRVIMLDFNKVTGEISIDETFRHKDSKIPGFMLDRAGGHMVKLGQLWGMEQYFGPRQILTGKQ